MTFPRSLQNPHYRAAPLDTAPLGQRLLVNAVAITLLPVVIPVAVVYHLITKRRVP